MPAAILHLTYTDNYPKNFSIEQGSTFDWLTIVVPSNYSEWSPRGTIRDRYLFNGGTIKGQFSFETLIFGEVTLTNGQKILGTKIRPYMSAETTRLLDWGKLQRRNYDYEKALPGINVWVYDIELESPNKEVRRILQGFVEVMPEVTA